MIDLGMSVFSFAKQSRLLNAQDFKAVFDDAHFKVHQPNFLFLAKLNTQHRLGLVVAKKKIRRAHERNRIKRLTRESFRLFQQIDFPIDIVVMPKMGIEQVSNTELLQQLETAWARLQYLAHKHSHKFSSPSLS